MLKQSMENLSTDVTFIKLIDEEDFRLQHESFSYFFFKYNVAKFHQKLFWNMPNATQKKPS